MQTVQAGAGEFLGKQVVAGELVAQLRLVCLIVGDAVGDLLPETLLRQADLLIENLTEVAEEAVEHVGEDRQHLELVRHRYRETAYGLGDLRVGIENHRFLTDVLHQHAHRYMVFQHQDQVLAMRHEHQIVGVEAMQQRRQIGVEIAAQPAVGGQARGADQRRQQGAFVAIAVQQRGHGHQPLAGFDVAQRALAPERRKHLAVGAAGRQRLLVIRVAIADGCDFAQQLEAAVAQHGVAGHALGEVGVDRRRRLHVVRRQPTHKAHVEDRKRGLHVAPLRLALVEEGADRLLRQVAVIAQTEMDDVPVGDLRGEADGQDVVPLPGVRGHQQVVVGVELQRPQLVMKHVELTTQLLAQQGRLVEPVDGAVAGAAAVHGKPDQAHRARRFRRVGAVILGVEAHPPVVGYEARVAFAHPGLDLLEVRQGQLGGAQRAVGELVGAAEQGAADLVEIDRQVVFRDAQGVGELDDEAQRVQWLLHAIAEFLDGVGNNGPVIQRQSSRLEAVLGRAVRHCDAVVAVTQRLGAE